MREVCPALKEGNTMELSHRKVIKKIFVKDAAGRTCANKDVRVKQMNHSFLFGCGAFDFIPYAAHDDFTFKDVTDKWLSLFNYATLPFYWGRYEPVEGKPDQDNLMKTARYLKDRNVKIKGHPLCWHTVCADWLLSYDNRTILQKQLARIEREVTFFKGVIDMWDVINEVVIMPVFDKYDNAMTRLCQELGRTGIIRQVFAQAKEANPEALLLLNDFNTSPEYEKLIDDCLNAGVPIGAIGIQSHQHQGYWGREKLEEVLDRFSRFALPVHFTENTLISGELMPGYIVDLNDWQVDTWPTTPEGEERQAEEIEEMYRILFAHPLVEAITTWDFMDGAWLHAPSGFLREDHTVKPSYTMLQKLIHEEWQTDTVVRTNSEGCAVVEAFKGDYTVSGPEGSAVINITDNEDCCIRLET